MSTTFGVFKGNFNIDLIDDYLPDDYSSDDFIEVAKRSSYFIFTNELGSKLPDDLRVYPLDNCAQGIYTIGDIKREIREK